MKKLKRTFIVEIKYPECDKLVKAEDYLQELIESDLVGDDIGRWCVNVKEVVSNDEKKEDKIKVQCFSDEPIGYEDEFSILNPIFEQKEFENAKQVVDYIVKTSTDYLDRYKSDITIDFNSMKCEEHDGEIYVMAMINNKLKIKIAKLNKMIEI